MSKAEDFLRHRERFRAWLLGSKYYKGVEALEWASTYHTGMRKDGVTPEFHHQISIAHYVRTLPNLRNQQDTLIVAMLHDLIEDYNVSIEEIIKRFGKEVADAVVLLSKKYKGNKKGLKEYFTGMDEDYIASVVKGADRIHNFQTMGSIFTCKKQVEYIEECEEFILPMLKRARNNFPDQELAYENIKHALKGQIELLRLSIESKLELEKLINLEAK